MLIIRPFLESDISLVKLFADQAIGQNYYSEVELLEKQKQSIADNQLISSFVLYDQNENSVKGIRLAFPPGRWSEGKGAKLRSDLWPYSIKETGYFQSLFLSQEVQGQGWGPKLSEESLKVFKKLGAKGIATHSWKESPNNSSVKYLTKMGFKPIIEHKNYWIDVDYVCTYDGKPCYCTAIEMYKIIE